MLERDYQKRLVKFLRAEGYLVDKFDGTIGHPDLLIRKGPYWAALEVKRNANAKMRPSQLKTIERFRDMGAYAAVIYPENEAAVLEDMRLHFIGDGLL